MSKMKLSKASVLRGAAVVGSVIAVPAFAQTSGGSIDVSAVTAVITEGLAAVATIGAAWVGLKYLKKVWNKV